MHCAAFNTGSDYHLLDHIAPLASLLDIPLFLTEEKNYELAKRYYPQTDAHYLPDIERQFSFLTAFDALFECKYWAPHLKSLFRDLYRKKMLFVFCPHGQSDKGYATPLLAPYATQDLVLCYGELLKTMIEELQIPANLTITGNYRLVFYQENQTLLDALAEKEIFSRLPTNKKTLLYAPTWSDADQATSFFESAPILFSQIPSDWNLLLKLHPLLEMRDPSRFYRIASLADRHANILLVSEFPLIYPLLSRSDAYLGDYSSVGYDFLFFQKPMFFLSRHSLPPARLHTCGIQIDSPKSLFSLMEKQTSYHPLQSSLYRYAFGENKKSEEIKKQIYDSLNRLAAAR